MNRRPHPIVSRSRPHPTLIEAVLRRRDKYSPFLPYSTNGVKPDINIISATGEDIADLAGLDRSHESEIGSSLDFAPSTSSRQPLSERGSPEPASAWIRGGRWGSSVPGHVRPWVPNDGPPLQVREIPLAQTHAENAVALDVDDR